MGLYIEISQIFRALIRTRKNFHKIAIIIYLMSKFISYSYKYLISLYSLFKIN